MGDAGRERKEGGDAPGSRAKPCPCSQTQGHPLSPSLCSSPANDEWLRPVFGTRESCAGAVATALFVWLTLQFFFVVFSCKVVSYSLTTPWTVAHQAPVPWDFPGKNTEVNCHFLLQGIFPIQRLNPSLLHWQADSLPLSHQGNLQLFLGRPQSRGT